MAGKNGGRLRRGGTNKGGLGRVPSSIRARARESYWGLIPRLERIAKGEKVMQTVVAVNPATKAIVTGEAEVIPKIGDQVKAAAELSKVGLGENISAEDIRSRLEQTVTVIKSHLAPDQAEALLSALDEVWGA